MVFRFPAFSVIVALIMVLFGTAAGVAANPYREYVQARLAAKSGLITGHTAFATPRIVGGHVSPDGSHRFQVALLFAGASDNFAAFYCGGSLYRGRFVITAAHCSDFVTEKSVRVLVGTHNLNKGGKRYKVRKIVVHPKWDMETFDYDIAVWCLEEEVPDAPKLRIAQEDPPLGTMMKVSGWGALTDSGGFPVTLREALVPRVHRDNCNDANSYNGAITKRMICAGFNGGGVDSCFGDSGGPLTKARPKGGRILTGIVSWGDGCALPDKFGVYTRVSNNEIRGFIRDVTWPWPMLSE